MAPRDDDDYWSGLHAEPPPGTATAPAAAPVAAPTPCPLRAGDTGAGSPDEVSVGERTTPHDLQLLSEDQRRRRDEERRRVEEMLASDQAVLKLPPFLTGPLVGAALLLVVALVGLFVFAQALSALASIGQLPAWGQYACWAGLALLVGLLLYAVGRFAVFYWRLQPNRPIVLRGLAELSQRTHLRWLAQEKKAEAKSALEAYLRAYPLGTARERVALAVVGLTDEPAQALDRARADLLDVNRFAGHDQWIDDFRGRFQGPLDVAAAARIVSYARRVAVMTAASPNALIDTLLTGYCGFAMLADLCRIYNVRVGRLGTAVLLGRVFFNAYLAGQLNEFEGVTEAGIQGLMSEGGVQFGSFALDAVTGKILGKIGARAASGALNYFLLKRLGTYAARLLRPVRADA